MQILRNFTFLARLVLAWVVLSLGVAVASPIVKPQNVLLVCTGAGAMKVLVTADDGSTSEVGSVSMDCPLCASFSAPPPLVSAPTVEPAQPLAYALQSIPAAHIAARTAAPLPARGPPTL
jgi:hypothetical protein